MLERGLQPNFPPAAVAQAEAITAPAAGADGVRDLRDRPWVSIDNDDSKDLDQLSVAEPTGGGAVRMLVAIADVDALVGKDSPVD
jgi:exoribonuclease-2